MGYRVAGNVSGDDSLPGKPERQPIRITHLVTSLEPGGLENGVVNLANGLPKGEFETDIVCLERVGKFADRLHSSIQVNCLEKGPGFSANAVRRLRTQLARRGTTILHTHNLGPLIYGVGAFLAGFGRVPILHGEHGSLPEASRTPKRLRQRGVCYSFCRQIHTVSASLREHLVGLGFDGRKISPVLNGVDCERFSPPANREEAKISLGIPQECLVVGMVGRLIASKRHLLVLEAFRRLRSESDLPVHLLVVGDGGSEREEIVQAIEEHPHRESILWLGHVDDPAPAYRAMDLLAMPSSVEGLSNALLESMATAVPCLAHPACGASEVIRDGENGVLAATDDADQLKQLLMEWLRRPDELRRLGETARRTAEKTFSLESMIEGYANLYRRCTER